jgi:hypothetical protein
VYKTQWAALGETTMKAATCTSVTVAVLGVLVVAVLHIGPRLPEPFHLLDGGWLIGVGLLVYVASLLALVLGLSGLFRLKDIVGLERIVLVISGGVIVMYCVYVSAVLFGLSQATDL